MKNELDLYIIFALMFIALTSVISLIATIFVYLGVTAGFISIIIAFGLLVFITQVIST